MAPAIVSLVSMPFKDLRHPPIQLGILQSCLQRVGFTTRTHSFELAFMDYLHLRTVNGPDTERISIGDYQDVAHRDFVVNLGDWIFKVPPFSEPLWNDDEYLAYIREFGLPEEAISTAIRMRALVPEFLDAAANEILSTSPRVVGFSTVFQQNIPSLVLAKILKIREPSLTIVFGGDNCDGAMGAALHENFPWVDVVVRGEGERVLVEIVEDVLSNRPFRPQPGLCYRNDGQSVVVPQEAHPQLRIDEVPMPVYDEYFDRLARSPIRAQLKSDVAILFESSRGCWWGAKAHCTFCGLNDSTMAFRSKSANRVAEEIMGFASKYKILNFVAVDDIIDLAHIRDLLPQLSESGYDLALFYETKANLTKSQLFAFRHAGVTAIQPGVESLSTPILRLMKKGVTALQNIRLLKWCAEIGIVPAWNLLYGFPGEPPDEYDRMADLIPSLVHFEPPSITPVQIQRFSPYFERPADFGLEVIGPLPQYRLLYPISQEALANLAYDFEHCYVDGRDPASYTLGLQEAVRNWQDLEEPGTLSYRRGPGFILVEDRRHGVEAADFRFDGAEAEIYLACDAGATISELRSQLASHGDVFDDREIEEFLTELVSARLMFREGNRFLSLAVALKTTLHDDGRAEVSRTKECLVTLQ